MYFADERRAIEERFATKWAVTAHAAVPVAYSNTAFDPPGTYVVLSILSGPAHQASIGATNPTHRLEGVIQVDAIVPEEDGTQTARSIADSAAGAFMDAGRGAQFSSGNSGLITCRTPHLRDMGVWRGKYRFVVSVPYHRDVQL